MIICGLVMHGFGIAAVLVASFTDALQTAMLVLNIDSKSQQFTLYILYIYKIINHHERLHSRRGLPDNIETYGLVSGLWTSTFAFGAFLGPSVSGLLYDSIGFRKAVIFIITLHLVVAFIVLITIIFERNPRPYKELGPAEPLLRNHESVLFDRS